MPDYIFHMELGEEFLERVPSSVKSHLIEYHNEYLLGLEGPDLFFYRAFFPGRNKKLSGLLGKKLHREKFSVYTYFILNGLKYFPPGEAKDLLFSYFTGFFAHLFVDFFFHPYIIYRTNVDKGKYRTLWLHKRFEMNIDYAYVSLKKGKFSPMNYVERFGEIKKFPETVALFFSKVLIETYELSHPLCCLVSNFKEAYKMTKFTLTFFEKQDIIRKYIIHPLIYVLLTKGKYVSFLTHPDREEFDDALNLSHKKWWHLELKREYLYSIPELVDKFIEFFYDVTLDMYKFVYEERSYPDVFKKEYSFSKGVTYEEKGISWIF